MIWCKCRRVEALALSWWLCLYVSQTLTCMYITGDLKMQNLIQKIWVRTRDSAFLANSHMKIMLTSKGHTLTINVIASLCTLVLGFILAATDQALPDPHPLSELLLWVTDQLCNWRIMGSLVHVFPQLIYALRQEIKAPILPYPRSNSESSVCKLLLNQKNFLDFLNISTFSPCSQDSLSFSFSLPPTWEILEQNVWVPPEPCPGCWSPKLLGSQGSEIGSSVLGEYSPTESRWE